LLFNEKSIREEKYTVNGKNRSKDRPTRETPEEKGTLLVWTLQIEGIRVKEAPWQHNVYEVILKIKKNRPIPVVLMRMEAFLPFLPIEME
jgi:hypothetical protein